MAFTIQGWNCTEQMIAAKAIHPRERLEMHSSRFLQFGAHLLWIFFPSNVPPATLPVLNRIPHEMAPSEIGHRGQLDRYQIEVESE